MKRKNYTDITTALYNRHNTQNGECYASLLAAGGEEEMKILQKHYKKKGEDPQLIKLKKVGLLKEALKTTITEVRLKGILSGKIKIKKPKVKPAL